jgi:hypothetical protein
MSPQNSISTKTPKLKNKETKKHVASMEKEGGKKPSLVGIAIGIGGFILIACLCVISVFGITRLTGKFFGPKTNFPKTEVKVVRQKTETITDEGGEVELENLQISIPEDAVQGEAEIIVAQVSPASLPVDPPEDVVGDVFAIEWQSTKAFQEEEVTLNFSFDPKDIPDGVPLSRLSIFTFDGEDWMRVPSEVDQENHLITTSTAHFSFWSWGLSRIAPDYTQGDIHVSGHVEFEYGSYQHDTDISTLPASGLRFALIDSDLISLEEDWLDDDGSFNFIVPEGTDVGLGLDVILRVYADHPDYGKVTKYTGPGAGAWFYNSEIYKTSLSTQSISFGTILIPTEHSGAFNILHAIGQGHRFSTEGGYWTPDPAHIIWAGLTDEEPFDNAFNDEEQYISISSAPQSAWDHDLIRSLYGEYLLYDLSGKESLFCSGRYDTMFTQASECWAWQKGWALFFGTASGDNSYYEEYRNRSSSSVELDLEENFYTDAPQTAASIGTLLWDLADRNQDGEQVSIPIDEIFQLLRNYGTQVDSIDSFYNFLDIRVGMDAETCLVFADYEVVEMEICSSFSTSEGHRNYGQEEDEEQDNQQEDEVEYYPITYGDNLYGELEFNGQDVYMFEGNAGDILEIGMMAYEEDELDPFVILIQEWDNRVVDQNDDMADGMGDSLIEAVELPEDGTYLILARGDGQGEYMIWLEHTGNTSQNSASSQETEPPIDPEPSEEPESTQEPEPTQVSEPTDHPFEGKVIDLGIVPHYDAPKTWTVEIPSDFTRVEVGCYGADNDEIMQYCGWQGSLSIDGETVWKFARYDSELGGIFHNYLLGEDIIEKNGKGLYLDVTGVVQSGEIEIEFDHNTSGTGAGIKVRITTEE